MPIKPRAKPRNVGNPLKRRKPAQVKAAQKAQAARDIVKRGRMNVVEKAVEQAAQIMAADDTVPAVTEGNFEEIAEGLTKILPTIPAFAQAANLEPKWRSRILNGLGLSGIGVLLPYILPQHTLTFLLPWLGLDISPEELNAIAGEVITVAGLVFAAAGRLFTWSRPAWSRLAGWISRLRGKPAVVA